MSADRMRAQGTANERRLRAQGRTKDPAVERGIPEPPPGFMAAAQPSWDFFAKELDARGVLSTADGPALMLLAYAHHDWELARTALAKLGENTIYQDSKGRPKAHPRVAQVRQLQRDLWTALGRFGLTPSDRHRVSAIVGATPEPRDAAWDQLERMN